MNAAKALCKEILTQERALMEGGGIDPAESGWTLQGLGMLRKYVDGERFRIHVWDDRYRTPGVSMYHDHPWDFESLCIAGRIIQCRYEEVSPFNLENNLYPAAPFTKYEIVCGPGGGACAAPEDVYLYEALVEYIGEGDTYVQRADEIHKSLPINGTVTLIERTFHENTENAHVFAEGHGSPWVTAEPRPAHPAEIVDILAYSLETRFGEQPIQQAVAASV